MNFDVAPYAPENARELSPEQLAAMEFFTMDQLKELARAFPNKSNQRPYLILKDKNKKDKDQIWSAMTWNNLYELHKLGQKHIVAISYKEIFFKTRTQALKTAPLQDLTRDEVLQGLKVKEVSVEHGNSLPPVEAPIANFEKNEFDETEDKEFEDLKNEAAAKTGKVKSVPVQQAKKTTKGKKK